LIKETFWLEVAVITIITIVGSVLYKVGVDQMGKMDFSIFMTHIGSVPVPDIIRIMKVIWNPYISIALICMFVGRLLYSAPLSTTGLGKLVAIITPLTIAGTVLASRVFFKEDMGALQYVGVVLSLVAVYLIEYGGV
jgi:multidrug transporter EmrE-like cation transporter